jgi:hypothetical protein
MVDDAKKTGNGREREMIKVGQHTCNNECAFLSLFSSDPTR